MGSNWAAAPGDAVVVSLDAYADGLRVRIASRAVRPAHRTALHTFIYSPRIWGTSLAGLGALVLVSTAFATGAIRPAPPAAPTPRAGEPTATPDTRPVISIGGFVLRGPVQPTPQSPGATSVSETGSDTTEAADLDTRQAAEPAAVTTTAQAAAPQAQPAPRPVAPPQPPAPPPVCTNLFGIGCPQPQPTPVPPSPAVSTDASASAPPAAPGEPAATPNPVAPVEAAAPPAPAAPGDPAAPPAPAAPGEAAAPPAPAAPGDPAVAPAPPAPGEPPARPASAAPGLRTAPPASAAPGVPTAAPPSAVPLQPATQVVPVASPAARSDPYQAAATNIGPRPGSTLDQALRVASQANEQFNRSLEPSTGTSSGSSGAPDP